MLGMAAIAVGALVALVGLLADTLGIGAEGADGIGARQVAMIVVGLVVAAIGAAVAFLMKGEAATPPTPGGAR